jgi:hypothetical protein
MTLGQLLFELHVTQKENGRMDGRSNFIVLAIVLFSHTKKNSHIKALQNE